MTTIARAVRRAEPYREIDVRCSAALPRAEPAEGRCQLFAGHDGPHAVMFAHCSERFVRTWSGRNPAAVADACPGALQRPWMFGYPVPAWFESSTVEHPG